MFKTIAKHAPPPPGVDSPLLWGTEERLRELFGDGVSDLRVERRISRQPFRSADHYIEFFRTYFGPTQMAYERVGPEGEQALTDDLRAFLEAANTAGDRATGARGRVPAGGRRRAPEPSFGRSLGRRLAEYAGRRRSGAP